MQWNKGAYFEMTTQAFYLGEGELLGRRAKHCCDDITDSACKL